MSFVDSMPELINNPSFVSSQFRFPDDPNSDIYLISNSLPDFIPEKDVIKIGWEESGTYNIF
ncbi:MAG: hypothetical protein AB2L24_22025 [Mangrovibacterium sp.]